MRSEDLGPEIYERASNRSMEIAMTPRDEYPEGAGLNRSVFTVQRSEPVTDEEIWPIITSANSTAPDGASQPATSGACSGTWNQAYVGHLERQYGPSVFGLVGPTVCQDELVLHWKSKDFWDRYYEALDKRNVRSLENRLRNCSMNFVPKLVATGTGTVDTIFTTPVMPFNDAGYSKSTAVIIPPDQVFMGDAAHPADSLPAPIIAAGVVTNYTELTQEILDLLSIQLSEDGATQPDDNGWITLGPDGPLFPLEIDAMESFRIWTNNANLRTDAGRAWTAYGDENPLFLRIGATRILRNFRHVPILTAPRWDWVTTGTDGGAIGAAHPYLEPNSLLVYGLGTAAYAAGTIGGVAYPAGQNVNGAPYGATPGCWVRRPVFIMSTSSSLVTKGYSAEVNPGWRNAQFVGTRVLSPWVMREEILRPIGAMGSMNWRAQNYMGDWEFVTGNDAFLGIAGCTGISDPLHRQGRHFGEYRNALKPIFPQYGRLIITVRCLGGVQSYRCS